MLENKQKIVEMVEHATRNNGELRLINAIEVIAYALRSSHAEIATLIEELRVEGVLSIGGRNCGCYAQGGYFYQNHGSCEWCYFVGDEECELMYLNVVKQHTDVAYL